ncbi:unnamed protein product [Lupinus luteus]|uniref:Uncharacterized protein n=1 Tax=Lupinus luteus TaxID=3873 RepID=A0AAV1W7G3_LUPLU
MHNCPYANILPQNSSWKSSTPIPTWARTMKSSSPITTSDSPRSRLHQIQHPKFLPTKTTSVQKSSSAKPTNSCTFVTPPRTDFYKNVVMPQDDFKQVTYRYQVISFSHPTAKKKYTSYYLKGGYSSISPTLSLKRAGNITRCDYP